MRVVSKTGMNWLLFCCLAALPVLGQQTQQQQRQRNQNQRMQNQNQQMHSQDQLEYQIQQQLAESRSLAGSDITANVTGSTVTLTGKVSSDQDKQRAERIARNVSGIQTVKNQLQVDKNLANMSGAKVTDEDLAKAVAQRLSQQVFTGTQAQESWLFGWTIKGGQTDLAVDVDSGTVDLDGKVASMQDLQKTIRTVRQIPGVMAIHSNVEFTQQAAQGMKPKSTRSAE